MFSNFALGFSQLSLSSYVFILLGSITGLIFGCIPGLSGSICLILAIPLTFSMKSVDAFALFMGVFIGGCSGGLISAILIGVPGTASCAATVLDGHPMARNGEPGRALGLGIFYSFFGTVLGLLVLFTVAEPLSRIALKLGAIELFSIILFALSLVSVLAGKDLIKGWIVALVGFNLGMVGMSSVDGVPRMIFGINKLTSGFASTAAMTGIFVVGSLFTASVADKSNRVKRNPINYKIKGFGFTFKEFVSNIPNMIRSGVLGIFIGILPGIGGITANLLSYSVAKSFSKEPDKFGKGSMEGIVASETSNNACIGGSMVPLLALGIPGDGFTTLLLGALMLHDFNPGPTLFQINGPFCYAIFAALIIAAILVVVIEYFGLPVLVQTLKIKTQVLMPIIMVLVMVGCISIKNRIFECYILLLFAFIAYVFRKFKFSTTPVILGFILGPSAEKYLRRGLAVGNYNLNIILKSPVCMVFIALAIVLSILFLQKEKRDRKRIEKYGEDSRITEMKKNDD